MKKIISIINFVLLFAGPNSWAASSGTLNLSGTVAAVNSVAITPNGSNNTTLDILNGVSGLGLNVATVAESSNDILGYIIQLSSINAGKLERNGTDTVNMTPYQISYDGGAFAQPSSSPTTVKTVSSLTGLTSHNSAVLIKVNAAPSAVAGSYSDTLTISIVGN